MRRNTLALAFLLAASASEAAISRYGYRVISSGSSSARQPQLIIADTAAECPSTDVGDGDLCYALDTDRARVRAAAAWVNLVDITNDGVSDGDKGDVIITGGVWDLDQADVEAELEGVLDLADLQGDLALGTKTSGDYVGEVQAGLGLTEAGSPGEGATSTVSIDHGQTLAGNPALNADECVHVATATGGGLLCEGGTADTNEMLFLIPDLSEADTTHRLVTESATQTLTNKTLAAADNVVEADTGDSATGFFGAGTIEDARIDGSAEADELVLAGDVDGTANANDIDEAAVETELEGVLDLQDLQGTLTAAKGGTGDSTSATTGVPRITTGDWTYDAGISHLASSTSAQLRTVLSDEVGTGPALFGMISTMQDDLSCTGSQVVRRNAGDTAFECATVSGGAAYDTIQEEGSPLTQRTTLNFVGGSITCVDDTTRTTCTISGGGSGLDHAAVMSRASLTF